MRVRDVCCAEPLLVRTESKLPICAAQVEVQRARYIGHEAAADKSVIGSTHKASRIRCRAKILASSEMLRLAAVGSCAPVPFRDARRLKELR